MLASFCVYYIERCQKGRARLREKELCVRVCFERSKDEVRGSSHPLTEVFSQLCTQLFILLWVTAFQRLPLTAQMRKPPMLPRATKEGEPPRRGRAMAASWAGCGAKPPAGPCPVAQGGRPDHAQGKGLWGLQTALATAARSGRRRAGHRGLRRALPPREIFIYSTGNWFKREENRDEDFIMQIVKCSVIWGARSLFIQKALLAVMKNVRLF